jgi:hypothetical protein
MPMVVEVFKLDVFGGMLERFGSKIEIALLVRHETSSSKKSFPKEIKEIIK